MGSVIGGVIGGLGSLFGGSTAQSADSAAAGQALTGYNYLSTGAGNPAVSTAQNNGVTAGNAAAGTQSAEAQLLGTAPMTSQTQTGFNNYLNSTGYNFQQQQGDAALSGSAAARGVLNSGSAAKALQGYGQNLASTTFNNYLGNLSGLNTQQQNTANAGTTAAQVVGQAGTTGGVNASSATQAGGAAMGNGITSAAGAVGGQASNALNLFNGAPSTAGSSSTPLNFFG